MFATAPRDRFLLRDFGFEGRKPGALVRAVAKRLRLGTPAGAPPVNTRLRRLDHGELLKDNRFAHGLSCNRNPPPAQIISGNEPRGSFALAFGFLIGYVPGHRAA
jgi:hypothetical protein